MGGVGGEFLTVVFHFVDLKNFLSLKPSQALVFLMEIPVLLVRSVDGELKEPGVR